MNRIAKLSTAAALGLSLMSASLAADAASARPAFNATQAENGGGHLGRGKVLQLGTIVVTSADAEGVKVVKIKPNYGSAAYLGRITVTPADSVDARYAANLAKQPGVMFLGTIQVKARNGKLPVLGNLVAAMDSTRTRNLLAVVGALVFERAGG